MCFSNMMKPIILKNLREFAKESVLFSTKSCKTKIYEIKIKFYCKWILLKIFKTKILLVLDIFSSNKK